MWCRAANDVRLQWALVESSVLDGERLVLMWCAATDVRLRWALVAMWLQITPEGIVHPHILM